MLRGPRGASHCSPSGEHRAMVSVSSTSLVLARARTVSATTPEKHGANAPVLVTHTIVRLNQPQSYPNGMSMHSAQPGGQAYTASRKQLRASVCATRGTAAAVLGVADLAPVVPPRAVVDTHTHGLRCPREGPTRATTAGRSVRVPAKCHQVASKREGTLNFADVKGLLHRELHCPVRLSKHQDFTSS